MQILFKVFKLQVILCDWNYTHRQTKKLLDLGLAKLLVLLNIGFKNTDLA